MNIEKRFGPSLERFDHLEPTPENLQRRRAYLEDYTRHPAPILAERAAVEAELQSAQAYLDALRVGERKDAELARLQVELATLRGEKAPEAPRSQIGERIAEAQAAVDGLSAQLAKIDARITQANEELLQSHGVA
jgi:chromosome segregation ATPase